MTENTVAETVAKASAVPAKQPDDLSATGPSPRDLAFVHIIESPKPEDLLEGRTEGTVLNAALELAGIRRFYNLTVNQATFRRALFARLGQALRANPDCMPIIHLSCHGNQEGIQLTDGTFLDWAELRKWLVAINGAVDGVLLCMSTCYGASGQRMAMAEGKELPFLGIVGHSESVAWADSAIAYVTFYHRLFRDSDLLAALEAMKAATGDSRFYALGGRSIQAGWLEYVKARTAEEMARRVEQAIPEVNQVDVPRRQPFNPQVGTTITEPPRTQ